MKNTSTRDHNFIESGSGLKRGAFGLAVSGVLLTATLAQAQVEALEANPLEPAGVGADRGIESRGRGSGGTRIGRSAGRAGRGEENPAETLLRDIDGTNYGRRTGHTLTRASKIPVARRSGAIRPASSVSGRGEVYFARRGDYENAIYAPRAGSYRYPAPRRGSAIRTLRQR
jgi:hypothetical protein